MGWGSSTFNAFPLGASRMLLIDGELDGRGLLLVHGPLAQLARPADLTPRHRFLERDVPTDPLRLDQQVRNAWVGR